MRKRIQDEFTNLPVTRQRKYQLRMQRDHRCTECGQPALDGLSRCVKHLAVARERQRKLKGSKRRYNTASYRVEARAGGKQWKHAIL